MPQTVENTVDSFKNLSVLVAGDLVLDCYWWGHAARLSPEAPVPVLLKSNTTLRCGGAANTAANLAALGARTEVLGLLGEDANGEQLRALLTTHSIGTSALLTTPQRPTTTKTRVIAGAQHIVRIDEEDTSLISPALAAQLLEHFERLLPTVDAVLLSDYAKGLLTFELTTQLIAAARSAGKPVFVDPKGKDFTRYQGATFLKPNRLELGLLTGQPLASHADTLRAGAQLCAQMPGVNLLVTEAADGMTCFTATGEQVHIASQAREVFDITGAGDTVIAAFSLAIAAGAPVAQAMEIASAAAGITIAVRGVGIVRPEDLKRQLRALPERALPESTQKP